MSHLLAILTLFGCLASSAGYGELWLRTFGLARGDAAAGADPLRRLYGVALGMGTLAYGTLALGLAGLLHGPFLGALVAGGWVPAVLFFRHGRKLAAAARGAVDADSPAARGAVGADSPVARWLTLVTLGFLGLLAIATLLFAMRPADGLEWDTLAYHLAAPRIYLKTGRISLIVYDSHTDFPFTMEMLYLLGLRFGGVAGAKLFHWAAGWLAAAAVGIWTARLQVRGRRLPQWAGPVAASVFASMPIVLWELGTAYVDLGTALFQILALAAVIDAVEVPVGKPRVRQEGAALAGVLSGFALGTKMTALLQFGLLGLGLLWIALRARGSYRGSAARAVLTFGLLGIAVGSPWYLKSWLWVHNPVYPFFYGLFPHSFTWTRKAAEAYAGEQTSFGLGRGPAAALLALWNLGLHGRAFYVNARSLAGDKLGSLGPVWIGVLPLALWIRGWDWKLRTILLYSGISIGVWFFMSQQSRYLMPVFAPLAVGVAIVLAELPSHLLRVAAGGFVAVGLACNLGMMAPVFQETLPVVFGQVGEREYLAGSLAGLYEAAEYVNALPFDSRVALYQENRGFYFDRRYFWANPLQHDLIPYGTMRSGDELAAALRRFGITHVLINFQFCEGVEESRWYQLLIDASRRGRLREVFRSRVDPGSPPPVRIYRLQ